MNEVINSAFDLPDERDYNYSDLLGAGILPERPIDFPEITIFNQGLKEKTKMSCTRAGIGHDINGQNKINGEEEIDIEAFWLRYLAVNPNAETNGASLQSALKQALDEKLIGGYFVVKTEEEINDALYRGYFIYTGSNNGDWYNVAINKEYKVRTDGKLVGHAWALPKKNTGLNSYGKDNGFFNISSDLYNTTYAKYAILPAKDYNLIDNYKKMIRDNIKDEMSAIAYDKGLWNGLDGDKPITRKDVVKIVLRAEYKRQKGEFADIITLLDNLK